MRILAVTRPTGEGVDTASLIRKLGWIPLIFHTVQIKPRPASRIVRELQRAVSAGRPDWLVLMSPRGVHLLRQALKDRPGLRKEIFGARVLAVGPRTRLALQRQGVRNVETPATYTSDGIVDHLSKSSLRRKRIVLARATQGSETLRRRLRSLGALVTTIRLYDSLIPDDEKSVSTFLSKARLGKVNATLFTSSLSATNLFKMGGTECSPRELRKLLGRCLVAAVGPVTAGRLRRLGVKVDLVPKEYLIEKAIASLVDAGRGKY